MKTMKKKLFCLIQFHDYVNNSVQSIDSKVKALKNYSFEDSTIDEITEKYYNEFLLDVPVLNINGTTMDKTEDCKVANDDPTANGGADTIDGIRFTLYIPFRGDSNLFSVTPIKFKNDYPFGEVKKGEIKIVYEVPITRNLKQTKIELKNNTDLIGAYLGYLIIHTKPYNANLKTIIKAKLEKRKNNIDKNDDTLKSFGFPLK